jgi:hypothetical protein
VFVVELSASGPEQLAAERKVDDLFLSLLAQFERQGRTVSPNRSPTFAPTLFAKDPKAKKERASASALDAAMNRLLADDSIHVETYGRPARPYSKLVKGPPQ